MTTRAFLRKLLLYLAPVAVFFAVPLLVTLRGWEVAPVSAVAWRHARASEHALYGPAYSNPTRGYKFASLELRGAPSVAIGTSRIMQVRSDFFVGREAAFYNAGGIITRIFDFRILLNRLQTLPTRRIILALDPWMFNEGWRDFPPDPSVEREYAGDYGQLEVIQRSVRVYPDLAQGKFKIADVFGASEAFGINAMSHGNGFLRDGSYRYEDILRHPEEASDFHFADTIRRINEGLSPFEPGDVIATRALDELAVVARRWKNAGFEVCAFMPPTSPTIVQRLKDAGRHSYVFRVGEELRRVLAHEQVPFVDFTECSPLECSDRDFIDGFHGGPALYAALVTELARGCPWLADSLDHASLEERLARPRTTWDLDRH